MRKTLIPKELVRLSRTEIVELILQIDEINYKLKQDLERFYRETREISSRARRRLQIT